MQTVILGLVNPLMALLFSAILGLLWWFDRSRVHNGLFAVAYLLLGIGFAISLMLSFRGNAWAFSYTHIPFSLGTIALIVGMCRRVGVESPERMLGLVAAAGFFLVVLIDIAQAPISSGLYVSNTTYGVMIIIGLGRLARRPRESVADRAIFVMGVLSAAQFFIRPTFTFAFESELALVAYRETVYYAILNTTVAVISLGLALSLIGAAIAEQFAMHRDQISRDLLSGLLTRQAFEAEAQAVIDRSTAEGVPVAMIIGDIDHFKQVNDIWGHQAGDSAITRFGELVLRTSRDTDLAGRVGGEEFCILVWNADETIAVLLAERLRAAVSTLQIAGIGPDIRLTSSFGCAGRDAQESYASLFKRADAALYAAKDNGRDRVEAASRTSPLSERERTERHHAIEITENVA